MMPDNQIELTGLEYPLVPDGEYTVLFDHHKTIALFQKKTEAGYTGGKLYLWFHLLDKDTGKFDTEIFLPFNVAKLKGKPGENGLFVPARRGKYFQTLVRLFKRQSAEQNPDPRRLKGLTILADVRTVKNNEQQVAHHENNQYSVIDKLIKVIDENHGPDH